MEKLIIFIFGLFFGSFLGVVTDRLAGGETIIKGRSHCDSCKKELSWPDLIPVLSFLILKGKCRFCKAELSLFYPIIELTTGILFVAAYTFSNFQFSIFNFQLMYYLFIFSVFIVIFFQDLKYGIISDKVVFPAILISLVFFFFLQKSLLINHLLSGFGSFIFFLVISYAFFVLSKKQGMGGGDIKLSFLLGLFLGFPNIIVSLYIAFLTGTFIAIILIVWKKKSTLKDTLPFGPFLILGAFISLFWGNQIYFYVLNLLGV